MSQEIKKTSSALGTVALVMLIAITTGFWLMVFYSDYSVQEGSEEIRIDDYEGYNITSVVVDYRASTASVNIYAADPSEEFIFTAYWRHLFTTDFGDEENKMGFNLTFDEQLADDNETLLITVSTDAENEDIITFMGIELWEFDIYINPAYVLNLTADVDTGSINLYANEAQFNGILVNQATGSFYGAIENTIINNSFGVVTDTGSISLALNNVTVNTGVSLDGNTGSVDFTAVDSILGDIAMESDTGSVDVDMESTVIGDLIVGSNTGSLDINVVDLTLNGNIDAQADTGSIDMEVSNMKLGADQTLTIGANTGSVDVIWIQEEDLGHLMSIDITADTGSISVLIDASNPAEFDVAADSDTGSEDVEFDQIDSNPEYEGVEVNTSDLAHMRQESFIDWFMGVYTFFHAQHIAVQILMIALLVAITVGAIVLAFYIVKLIFQIIFWIFKGIINLLKSIGGNKKSQPTVSNQPAQPVAQTATVIPATVIQAAPVVSPVVAQKLHCPNCGREFTPEMTTLIQQKTETFCEGCGAKLKI